VQQRPGRAAELVDVRRAVGGRAEERERRRRVGGGGGLLLGEGGPGGEGRACAAPFLALAEASDLLGLSDEGGGGGAYGLPSGPKTMPRGRRFAAASVGGAASELAGFATLTSSVGPTAMVKVVQEVVFSKHRGLVVKLRMHYQDLCTDGTAVACVESASDAPILPFLQLSDQAKFGSNVDQAVQNAFDFLHLFLIQNIPTFPE
jgi:hypothetical protein